MDSGVFEPVSRSCTRFDDTLLKFYKFRRADDSQEKSAEDTASQHESKAKTNTADSESTTRTK